MENCLVTRLKGSVNADLGYLGKLIIRATSATKVNCWLTSKSNQEVTIINPHGNVISTVNLTANNRADVGVADMTGYDYVDIVIPNKYDLTMMYCHSNSSFGGSSDAKYIVDGRNLNYAGIAGLTQARCTFVENIEKLTILPNANEIEISTNDGSSSDKKFLPNKIFYNTHITTVNQFAAGGASESDVDIKNFIEWMCAQGRTEGTLVMDFSNNNKWHFGDVAGSMSGKAASCAFSATGCVITNTRGFFYASATYNKTTGVWTYVEN